MSDTPQQQPRRQYVIFNVYATTEQWDRAGSDERQRATEAFRTAVDSMRESMMIMTYSTLGLKTNADFLLWCVSFDLEDFEKLASLIRRSAAGPYLKVTTSFLAMTKHSQYVREHVHEGQEGRRLRIVPGERPYLFVYPFVKTRPWYMLPMPERQRMMNEHIAVGHRYPKVKINTTYSFGLDDHEFVVAFEAEEPADFLDLVQELRETEASSYTLRDTPMYTCIRRDLGEILSLLG